MTAMTSAAMAMVRVFMAPPIDERSGLREQVYTELAPR
jgi:hypothetical protein